MTRQIFWYLTQAAVFCGLVYWGAQSEEMRQRFGVWVFLSLCFTALFSGICMRLIEWATRKRGTPKPVWLSKDNTLNLPRRTNAEPGVPIFSRGALVVFSLIGSVFAFLYLAGR